MLYQDILIHTENSIYYLNGVQESEKKLREAFHSSRKFVYLYIFLLF